jgi:hypothetical protein
LRFTPLIASAWLLSAGLALAQAPSQVPAQAPADTDAGAEIRELSTRGGPVPDDAGPREPRSPGHGGQLFISPSGEPFRAPRGAPYPVAAWFNRVNKAHDGKLTRAEFVADAEAFFAKLDTNHDGVIDGFENQDYEQKIVPDILPHVGRLDAADAGYGPDAPGIGREAGTPHRRSGGGGGGRRRSGQDYVGAAPYSLINEPQPVMGADSDFDQRITLDEFRRAANQRFDLLDKKHQGYLTLADLPKTPIQQVEEQIAAEERKKNGDHAGPVGH